MFKKINKFLARFEKQDQTFVFLRKMLRDALLPLGFKEEVESLALGSSAVYRRDDILVELILSRDFYPNVDEREYSFFISTNVQSSLHRPRQISMTFTSTQYTPEKEKALRDTFQQWLKTIAPERDMG